MVNHKPARWWLLAAMAISLGMNNIDQIAVIIAIPKIQQTFALSPLMSPWIVNAYLLPLGAFMVLSGRLGDLFQHRRVFLIGLTLFFITSVGCGLSISGDFLIVNRVIQGIGAALMLPNSTVLVLNTFAVEERGKAMGIYIGVSLLFIPLALVLGGLFTEFFSWRLIFLINLPLGILCFAITFYLVPPEPALQVNTKFDWWGAITLLIALSTLVIILMQSTFIKSYPFIITCLAISFIFFILFYFVEKNNKAPLVDFKIFKNKIFSCANILFFCMATAFSLFTYEAFFYQNVLGYSAGATAVLFFPSVFCVIIGSIIFGKLYDVYGYKRLLFIGLVLSFIGLLTNSFLVPYLNYWYLLFGIICIGIGTSLVLTPINIAALSSVELHDRGIVSGILISTRQIASTICFALATIIILGHNQFLQERFVSTHQDKLPNLTVEDLNNAFYENYSSINSIFDFAQINYLRTSAQQIFAHSYALGLLCSALTILFGFICAYFLIFKKPTEPVK